VWKQWDRDKESDGEREREKKNQGRSLRDSQSRGKCFRLLEDGRTYHHKMWWVRQVPVQHAMYQTHWMGIWARRKIVVLPVAVQKKVNDGNTGVPL
jgi:hypothetical protein